MKEVLLQLGSVDSIRAIQIGYEVIRVTFSSPVAFHQAKSMEGVHLFGFWCPILGGGPQPTMIHVFDFPFEGPDAAVEVALKAFGSVRGIRKKKPTSVIAPCLLALSWSLWSSRELYRVFFKLTATDVVSGTMGKHWYAIFVPNVGSVDNLAILRKCGQSGHSARQCTNACTSVGAEASASPLPEETFPSSQNRLSGYPE